MARRTPRVAGTGRSNRSNAARTAAAAPGLTSISAPGTSRAALSKAGTARSTGSSSLSAFSTGRSSLSSDALSEASSRISFRQPSTVRTYGVRSDTSSAKVARERGVDLRSRIQQKVNVQERNISNVFRKFDTNKNGTVDHDEFRQGLSNLGFDVDKPTLSNLLKWVDPEDRGEIEYKAFANAMSGVDQSSARPQKRSMRHYAAALRDNFGESMHVARSANAIEVGQVGVGEGAMAGENRFQRDVGDRATVGDMQNFNLEHDKGTDLQQVKGVPHIERSDGRDHVHVNTNRGLSYFEQSLRTPRYPRMNKAFAALRTFSPGMEGCFVKNVYGEQAHVDFSDPYGRKTVVEPLTYRSTASFRAESRYTGGVKPVATRSELFAKRRGENFRENETLKFAEPFGSDASAKRVYHFVKDKPKNAGFNNNRRMGDLKFDPKTGVDLVKFEKEALAKRARKVVKQALKRREEALVGRGH